MSPISSNHWPSPSGVGKTSLVLRYAQNSFSPGTTPSTVGASFVTKRVLDDDSNTTVRLQIWDTAGQERFRSISRLYYRGANAAVLVYDITDAASFDEMAAWLREIRKNLGHDVILHAVGTKTDLVEQNPSLRQVPFERCIAYVAENLYPQAAQSPTMITSPTNTNTTTTSAGSFPISGSTGAASANTRQGAQSSASSKRSSGFWGQDIGWDVCHEVSAKDGEGIEEVFRVITRKLVEQRNNRLELEMAVGGDMHRASTFPGVGEPGLAHARVPEGGGSFRVGRDRRSWMGFPSAVSIAGESTEDGRGDEVTPQRRGKCC